MITISAIFLTNHNEGVYDMKKFIKTYKNPNEVNFNLDLINKYSDGDIVPYIIDACKSIEVLEYITFLDYKWTDDESEIDPNDFIRTRNQSKSKKKQTRCMWLQDSRYGQLTVWFRIDFKGESKVIEKKILVPIADELGYYTIKGKKYVLYWQLVDSSTYANRNELVFKSLMPLSVMRERGDNPIVDIQGYEYDPPIYKVKMFKSGINALLFYFARLGVNRTLEYFSVDQIISFVETCDETDEENIYFRRSKTLFIKVNKYFFETYQYVQSIVAMIIDETTNRLQMKDLDSLKFWVEKLGSKSITSSYNYYAKGLSTLVHFDRLLDEGSKRQLRVKNPNKKNVYSIVRWIIQNFNELRRKDVLSLENKRIRCNEYIASLLTKAFSDRVNRVIRTGNKNLDMKRIEEIFSWNGDVIMQALNTSNLLRYDDRINDMDIWSKLKYTAKGPNSLGNKNENNVKIQFRGIHPSYIGRIDINVCGSSDPGLSGVFTPMCKTYGLYFNDKTEPEEFAYELEKEICEKISKHTDVYLDVSNMSMDEFYDSIEKMDNIREILTADISIPIEDPV